MKVSLEEPSTLEASPMLGQLEKRESERQHNLL
jgi:hypothetical protein